MTHSELEYLLSSKYVAAATSDRLWEVLMREPVENPMVLYGVNYGADWVRLERLRPEQECDNQEEDGDDAED